MGDYIGNRIWLIWGDGRSLDYGSCDSHSVLNPES